MCSVSAESAVLQSDAEFPDDASSVADPADDVEVLSCTDVVEPSSQPASVEIHQCGAEWSLSDADGEVAVDSGSRSDSSGMFSESYTEYI